MAIESTKYTYKAQNVANYIIFLASQGFVGDNKEREGITNLKLQKVLYFAQAYFLAKLNRPLFNDKLEAWTYGPVVPSLYRKYKRYGNRPIISESDESSIKEDDKKILKKVWGAFGGYSASRLVDIVHGHAPWKDANDSSDQTITQDVIRDYYAPLLNK